LAEGAYRDEIIAKILYMGSKEKYNLVTDYIWYVSVLQTLSRIQGSSGAAATHGKVLSEQLMEIALRVDTVRPYAVESMLAMLLDGDLILGQARQTVSEVSICVYYLSFINNIFE
jgi:AP-3 complex subunit delta-1